jgi:ubiquitin
MSKTPYQVDQELHDPLLRAEAQRDRYRRYLEEIAGRDCRHPDLGLLCPCSPCLAMTALNWARVPHQKPR